MKKLIGILFLVVILSCSKEKVETDQCPVCAYQSTADQLKLKSAIIRTQDNYRIWQESYLCKNCGSTYELYKKTKIE